MESAGIIFQMISTVPASFISLPFPTDLECHLCHLPNPKVNVSSPSHSCYIRAVTLAFVSDFTIVSVTLYCNHLLMPPSSLQGYELPDSTPGSSMVSGSQKLVNRV